MYSTVRPAGQQLLGGRIRTRMQYYHLRSRCGPQNNVLGITEWGNWNSSQSLAINMTLKGRSPVHTSACTFQVSSEREPLTPENWSESDYNQNAEEFLEDLEEALVGMIEDVDHFDMYNSQGVLTINLAEKGTYVLNKQTPNRQIWWSSPISGPKRYYYDAKSRDWLNTRDDSRLLDLLRDELNELLGVEVDLLSELEKPSSV